MENINMKIGVLYTFVDEIQHGFEQDKLADNEIIQIVDLVRKALKETHEVVPVRMRRNTFFQINLHNFDFIFNLCEGLEGNAEGEAAIAAYLEAQQIPFTGSNHLTLALSLDKVKTKEILIANGIRTPKYQLFRSSVEKLNNALQFPLIVKPIHEDASIGINVDSVVNNEVDLKKKVQYVLDNYDQPALVEEYIDGREVNASILGNGENLEVLPLSEIIFDLPEGVPRIVDYASKWVEESEMYQKTNGTCPADLPPAMEALIRKTAIQSYQATGCRDYARVDFRITDDKVYVLEVNPNPGINIDSGFFRSISHFGLTYPQMIEKILDLAVIRTGFKERPQNVKKPVFSSSRIDFFPISIENIHFLLKWFNSFEITKYMADPTKKYCEEELIQDFILSDDDGLFLIAVDKINKTKFGYCAIYDISSWNQTGEIAFLIGDPAFYQQGYGKELVHSLTDMADTNLHLNRLIATATELNIPSIKTLERCGYRRVGVLHQAHYLESKKYDDFLFEKIICEQSPKND